MWSNQQFWEATFYEEVQREIRNLYQNIYKDRQTTVTVSGELDIFYMYDYTVWHLFGVVLFSSHCLIYSPISHTSQRILAVSKTRVEVMDSSSMRTQPLLTVQRVRHKAVKQVIRELVLLVIHP